MKFLINIANTNILISSIYKGIYNTCRDYLAESDAEPDVEIIVDEKMIDNEAEREKEISQGMTDKQSIERLLIQRLIAEALIDKDTFLMHGAVIAVKNEAHLFTAPSGTGKTTHIQHWLDNVEGSFVVNGDKPFILLNETEVFACGTPWRGKEKMGTNAIVPLRSIVFMERSTDNCIEEASFKTIFPLLLKQIYWPQNESAMRKTLRLLSRLKGSVRFYKFYFNNYKEDVFQVSFDTLIKDKGCDKRDN